MTLSCSARVPLVFITTQNLSGDLYIDHRLGTTRGSSVQLPRYHFFWHRRLRQHRPIQVCAQVGGRTLIFVRLRGATFSIFLTTIQFLIGAGIAQYANDVCPLPCLWWSMTGRVTEANQIEHFKWLCQSNEIIVGSHKMNQNGRSWWKLTVVKWRCVVLFWAVTKQVLREEEWNKQTGTRVIQRRVFHTDILM